MSVNQTTGNLYPGLAEGPIKNSSSSIINAIVGDTFLMTGDAVRVLPSGTFDSTTRPSDILPRVGVVTESSQPMYGIVVGGNKKGVYLDGFDPGRFVSANAIEKHAKLGTLAGVRGDSVRVCTQGVCLARIVSRINDDIKIGDRLTSENIQFFNFFSIGTLVKAFSNTVVIARALQPVPVGGVFDPQVRVAAVDVQREGILP